ncbi:MAG: hypothetical protein GX335_09695 [Firmicutes bacterium]|nr:hypothetical protein [Bacillota bacterium]
MQEAIRTYWESGFSMLDTETYEEVADFLYDNLEEIPVVTYRGLQLAKGLEEGDTIPLQDMEGFASVSPDKGFAWNFALHGGYILVIPGRTLRGYRINEEEYLVVNEDMYVTKIEYDAKNHVHMVFCE